MAGENIFLSSRTLSVLKSFKSLIFFFFFPHLFARNSSDGVSSFSATRCTVSPRSVLPCPSAGRGPGVGLSPWRLTVGRPVVQEVGRHFPFTFDLDHAAALQHVTFVCQHLVEVCGHLWGCLHKDRKSNNLKAIECTIFAINGVFCFC